jgi:hypothetical protein
MALLIFTAAGNSKCTYQNKRDLEGASPAHTNVPALGVRCCITAAAPDEPARRITSSNRNGLLCKWTKYHLAAF